MPLPEPIIVMQNETGCVYLIDALVVLDWRNAPSEEDTLTSFREIKSLADRMKDGIAMLAIVRDSSDRLPDADARRAVQKVMRELKPAVRWRCAVIEGEGVLTTLIRTFFVAINTFLADSATSTIHGHIDSAAAWLMPRLCELRPDAGFDRRALVKTVGEMKSEWDRAVPIRAAS